jgi:hypothetical protein
MQEQGQFEIDNESRELQAVHHLGNVVAEAGQIFRPTPNSDHGIDGEIEFKDDNGCATGRRLYVQIKSGDSYLRLRHRDRAEVFQIKNARWAEYWQQQAYPVMLVVRTSDRAIRWMDVSARLRELAKRGQPLSQIEFDGDVLDVLDVRRKRAQLLSGEPLHGSHPRSP